MEESQGMLLREGDISATYWRRARTKPEKEKREGCHEHREQHRQRPQEIIRMSGRSQLDENKKHRVETRKFQETAGE